MILIEVLHNNVKKYIDADKKLKQVLIIYRSKPAKNKVHVLRDGDNEWKKLNIFWRLYAQIAWSYFKKLENEGL